MVGCEVLPWFEVAVFARVVRFRRLSVSERDQVQSLHSAVTSELSSGAAGETKKDQGYSD